MQQLSRETWVAYERRLERALVPARQRPDYHKWIRFDLDFCHKYGHAPRSSSSLEPFLSKLAAKNQSVEQRHQAARAVSLLLGASPELGTRPAVPAPQRPTNPAPAACGHSPVLAVSARPVAGRPRPMAPARAGTGPCACHPEQAAGPGPPPVAAPASGRRASWEKEYRDLEASIKLRNYSRKTLAAYRLWVGKFQAFVRSRPAEELGGDEVRGFLSALAVRDGVAASTQNQAFRLVEGGELRVESQAASRDLRKPLNMRLCFSAV